MCHVRIKVMFAIITIYAAHTVVATEVVPSPTPARPRSCLEAVRWTVDSEDQVALLQTSVQTHVWSNSSKPQRNRSLSQAPPHQQFDSGRDSAANAGSIKFSFKTKSGYWHHGHYLLYSAKRQLLLWSCLALFTVITAVVFYFTANMEAKTRAEYPAYFLAATSCMAFGIDNYISSRSNAYLYHPTSHIIMVFVFDGAAATIGHMIMTKYKEGYEKDWEATVSSQRALIFTFLTAFFLVGGMFTGNIGFSLDIHDAGPHQALICGDVLVVSPFFYMFYGECLSKVQIIGCALIIGGMLWMSNAFASPEDKNELPGTVWLFISMLFYAASIITWRLISTGDEKAAWEPRLLLIFGFMGVLGIISSFGSVAEGAAAEYIQNPILFFWPLLDCIASLIGMCAINLAYENVEASTGAITAIVDANSVLLMLLHWLFEGIRPSNSQLAGMMIILTGCFTVCSGDVGDEDSDRSSSAKSVSDSDEARGDDPKGGDPVPIQQAAPQEGS
jgi:drug/metabolite transporter (DMT)-like permease